ncbi:MAG: amino acid ABC transporter permease [Candidatus Entotheonellia bacterium]
MNFDLHVFTAGNLQFLWYGFLITLQLAALGIFLSFWLGMLAALGRLSKRAWLHYPAVVYIEAIRGVPLIMVILWFYFFTPVFTGRPLENFSSALVAFVIFYAAYLAEDLRSGIQSVALGQVEAARSTGLSQSQTLRYIVLPQALRNILPSLVTRFIILFKDTSLAYVIGVRELTHSAYIISQREFRPFELYALIAVIYWICTFSMSRFAKRLETRLTLHRA